MEASVEHAQELNQRNVRSTKSTLERDSYESHLHTPID